MFKMEDNEVKFYSICFIVVLLVAGPTIMPLNIQIPAWVLLFLFPVISMALLKTGYIFKSHFGKGFDKINTIVFCIMFPLFSMSFAIISYA